VFPFLDRMKYYASHTRYWLIWRAKKCAVLFDGFDVCMRAAIAAFFTGKDIDPGPFMDLRRCAPF